MAKPKPSRPEAEPDFTVATKWATEQKDMLGSIGYVARAYLALLAQKAAAEGAGRREAVEKLGPWLRHSPNCTKLWNETAEYVCPCGLSAVLEALTRG